MKVYVDELPKDCLHCPCFDDSYGCYFNIDFEEKNIPQNCPLQSLTDYTKQVRKEVCEEIIEEFEPKNANYISETMYPPTKEATLISKGFKACKQRLFKKLDQIQGETK